MYQGNKVDEMHAAALPTARILTRAHCGLAAQMHKLTGNAADAGQDGNDAGEIP